MKIFYIACGVLVLSSLIGCGGGGSGGGGSSDDGRIYVADGGNDRLIRMDNIDGDNWTSFGSNGAGDNQFAVPTCITFDSQGRIYVSDWGNNRIVRMDNFTGAGWVAYGGSGSGVGEFQRPNKIAIDGNGKIYITDTDNNRIVRIDDMSGANWVAYGSSGNGVGEFDGPYAIAVDSNFRIYVGDAFNSRIIRIDDMTGLNWTVFTYPDIDHPGDIKIHGNKMLINDRGGRTILTDLMSTTGLKEILSDTPQSSAMGSGGGIYVVDQSLDLLSRYNSINGGTPQTYGVLGQNEFGSPTHVVMGP